MFVEKEFSHCLRCGRKLKNPEARKRGFGDICYKKYLSSPNHPLFEIKERNNQNERTEKI